MDKLLVTGASGNVGGYVARYALQGGQEVKLAGSRPEVLKERFGATAEAVEFNFTEPSTFPLAYCHIRPSFFMQNISGVHAFEICHFDRIVVPVGHALTSFIDAEDIGELTAKVLSEPERHQNRGYALTGPEAIDYDQAAAILSQELGRTITYADPKPSLAKRYWIDVRGLDREYAAVMGKAPQTFRDFVRKNRTAWLKP